MTKKKHLFHMFSRDYTLLMNEWWYRFATKGFKRVLGRGLPDQVTHFTGRTSRCFRAREDFDAMRDHVLQLPLTNRLFRADQHQRLRQRVAALRKVGRNTAWPSRQPNLYRQALKQLDDLYPYFALGVYIPGHWAARFRQQHGKAGEPIIKDFYEDRERTEGIFEHVNHLTRLAIGYQLHHFDLDKRYINVITSTEMDRMVRSGTPPREAILHQRLSGYVLAKGKLHLKQSFSQVLRKYGYVFREEQVQKTLTALHGTVAWRGPMITGQARVVMNTDDVATFPENGILVSPMTVPDFLPAMKKAKAIITDEGGLTCHAAIVARELKIPCVIGTKIATQVLKDGDRVEVDATKGTVRKL